jgi:alkylation response protein AidB-like acyl-CoA dehydrogenase
MRYSGLRTMSRLALNREPGALEAINKLHWSEFQLTLGEWAIDFDESLGLVRPEGDGYEMSRWQDLFLSSRSGTIYSGTSEIQRNIIAERVLGLPKEPKVKG